MVKCPKEAILKGDTMVLPTLAKTILTNSSTAVAMVDPNNSMVRRMMLIHLLGTTIEVRVTLYWAMRITLTITVVAPNTYTANSEPQGYGRSEDTQDYGSRRQQGSGYNEGYGGGDEPSSYSRRRNDDGEQPPLQLDPLLRRLQLGAPVRAVCLDNHRHRHALLVGSRWTCWLRHQRSEASGRHRPESLCGYSQLRRHRLWIRYRGQSNLTLVILTRCH